MTAPEFAALMAPLGPFEPRPRIAVAVSGGRDSMALAMLSRTWAIANRGSATALVVDHGLRPEAAAEADRVARWLKNLGLSPRTLRWQGPHPESDVQAAARTARYDLMEQWCAEHGVLHLLIAHQKEDQAETLLLRLGRGSGLYGLSAMAAVTERPNLRLLRPLLDISRDRLGATLRARGQDWIDDPANEDVRYARSRLRAALPALGNDELTVSRLAGTAARLGQARTVVEDQVGLLLARAATVHPAGHLWIDRDLLAAAPVEVAQRALARCVMTMSGTSYGARMDGLGRLHRALLAQSTTAGRTLGGCHVRPRKEGTVLICREVAAAAGPLSLQAGRVARWDGRFRVRTGRKIGRGLTLGALGTAGWAGIQAEIPTVRRRSVPGPARPALPALWRRGEVLVVPHLGYRRPGLRSATIAGVNLAFCPRQPLTAAQFGIV